MNWLDGMKENKMKCSECYWCKLNHALSDKKVCNNQKSENYNIVFPKEEAENRGCDHGETRDAVEYRTMTPWEFASKHYM